MSDSYPACKCVDKVDKLLREKPKPEELVLVFGRDANNEIVGIPVIETNRSNGSRGTTALMPSYCPFCGKQYFSGTIRISAKMPHLGKQTVGEIRKGKKHG